MRAGLRVPRSALRPVWKSNHDLHAIDAPARWRGGVDSAPFLTTLARHTGTVQIECTRSTWLMNHEKMGTCLFIMHGTFRASSAGDFAEIDAAGVDLRSIRRGSRATGTTTSRTTRWLQRHPMRGGGLTRRSVCALWFLLLLLGLRPCERGYGHVASMALRRSVAGAPRAFGVSACGNPAASPRASPCHRTPESCQRDRAASAHPVPVPLAACAHRSPVNGALRAAFASPVDQG